MHLANASVLLSHPPLECRHLNRGGGLKAPALVYEYVKGATTALIREHTRYARVGGRTHPG